MFTTKFLRSIEKIRHNTGFNPAFIKYLTPNLKTKKTKDPNIFFSPFSAKNPISLDNYESPTPLSLIHKMEISYAISEIIYEYNFSITAEKKYLEYGWRDKKGSKLIIDRSGIQRIEESLINVHENNLAKFNVEYLHKLWGYVPMRDLYLQHTSDGRFKYFYPYTVIKLIKK